MLLDTGAKKLARRLQNKTYGELAQCLILRGSYMSECEKWTFGGIACRTNGKLHLVLKQIQEECANPTRNSYSYNTEMELIDTVRYE